MNKVCFKCGIEKDLTEFYAHPQMGDGHLNKCKECTKNDVRLNRIEHPERLCEYEKKRSKQKERKDACREHNRRWRLNNPEKYKAHKILNNAIRDGRVIKKNKCEICGSGYFVHGHHPDYLKPLEVIWLCATCHGQIQ